MFQKHIRLQYVSQLQYYRKNLIIKLSLNLEFIGGSVLLVLAFPVIKTRSRLDQSRCLNVLINGEFIATNNVGNNWFSHHEPYSSGIIASIPQYASHVGLCFCIDCIDICICTYIYRCSFEQPSAVC